jgi:N-acyl-D-aspartate/D-glutamate deacylase
MYDLIIHGGTLIDGTGADSRQADVAIDGDRYTIKSGEVTYDEGKPTGALPGKLVREPQPTPNTLS